MTSYPSFLFVCTGNICRSPLAEIAMRAQAQKRQLNYIKIDSAGTGDWNVGSRPDHRSCAVAKKNGFDINFMRARQISETDFLEFTHIFALDESHLRALKSMQPASSTAEIKLLLDSVENRKGQSIADPYYGPAENFNAVWDDVSLACQELGKQMLDPLLKK